MADTASFVEDTANLRYFYAACHTKLRINQKNFVPLYKILPRQPEVRPLVGLPTVTIGFVSTFYNIVCWKKIASLESILKMR